MVHDCSKCTDCQENEYCYGCFLYHKRIYVEWSSGNKDIDSLINECNKINIYKGFEWIPFERFTNVEYLAKGGFGSIYKASWLDGPIDTYGGWNPKWDHEQNKFKRWGEYRVVLKSLRDSKQITSEFRNEVNINNF